MQREWGSLAVLLILVEQCRHVRIVDPFNEDEVEPPEEQPEGDAEGAEV